MGKRTAKLAAQRCTLILSVLISAFFLNSCGTTTHRHDAYIPHRLTLQTRQEYERANLKRSSWWFPCAGDWSSLGVYPGGYSLAQPLLYR